MLYYAAYLAGQQLSPQTIKTYLAGIRHTQILLGLPEPREFLSLPRLCLVQSGIQRSYSQKSPASNKIRLLITPAILLKIRNHWISRAKDLNTIMLWAAATVCFFGFFRTGEITTTGVTSFSPTTDLAWGGVTIDNSSSPQMLQIYLKRSKTDQAGKGAHIYILGKQMANYVQCQLPWHTWQVEGLSQVHSSSSRTVHHLLKQNFLHQSEWLFKKLGFPT